MSDAPESSRPERSRPERRATPQTRAGKSTRCRGRSRPPPVRVPTACFATGPASFSAPASSWRSCGGAACYPGERPHEAGLSAERARERIGVSLGSEVGSGTTVRIELPVECLD